MTLAKSLAIRSLAFGTLAAAGILLVFLCWRLTFPATVFRLQQPLRVVLPENAETVRPGDAVTVQIDYCKTTDVAAIAGFYLIAHGVVVPLSLMSTTLPAGCHSVDVYVHLPEYLPPDTYRLYMSRMYTPMPLAQETYVFGSNPFTVAHADR